MRCSLYVDCVDGDVKPYYTYTYTLLVTVQLMCNIGRSFK